MSRLTVISVILLAVVMVISVGCGGLIEKPVKEVPWTGEGPPPPPKPGTKWVTPKELSPASSKAGSDVSETPITSPSKPNWIQVVNFSGIGNRATPVFSISGAQWRINWSVETKRPDLGVFVIYVYPEGKTGFYFTEDIMHDCDGDYSDTTYIHQGSGSYYLKVDCSNLKSWHINIEDYTINS